MATTRTPHLRHQTSNSGPDLAQLEAAFSRTAIAKRIHKRILALQRRLKPKLDDAGWRLYLALEEALNERQAALLDYLQRHVAFQCKQASRARRATRSAAIKAPRARSGSAQR